MKEKAMAAVLAGFTALSANAATTTSQTSATTTTTATAPQTGDAFLKSNAKKPGVVTLTDGLQYKIITAGKGPKPVDNDTVVVDYAGKLINGQEFDSSTRHGGPISFRVEQVIPGWVEALKLMPVGSTWEVYIPPQLAYGQEGAPPAIGPNETLIFKITLHDIKKS